MTRRSSRASDVRALLLGEHEKLRGLLRVALDLAARAGRGEPAAGLAGALEDLRVAFAAHNASEEAMLEPILREDLAWGPARVARMIEEHTAEHATFRALLAGSDLEVAARLADVAEDLDAHMAAEERTFLSPGVLRP